MPKERRPFKLPRKQKNKARRGALLKAPLLCFDLMVDNNLRGVTVREFFRFGKWIFLRVDKMFYAYFVKRVVANVWTNLFDVSELVI